MAQATLTWTPAGGSNSNSQLIQYRVKGTSTWITFSTEVPTVSSKTVTGLTDNQVYEFKIVNNCAVGGPISSSIMESIKFTCPQMTNTKTYNSITVSFPDLGAAIDLYDIKLYNSSNTLLTTYTVSPPFSTTVSHTFSSLSSSTTYNVRVIPHSGTYSKQDCATSTVITDAPPTCDVPTVVSASMS